MINRPLAEQNTKELSSRIERNRCRIEEIYSAINDAEKYMRVERNKFNEIICNPDEAFKKHKRDLSFILFTMIFLLINASAFHILKVINQDNLSYWAKIYINHNIQTFAGISAIASAGLLTIVFYLTGSWLNDKLNNITERLEHIANEIMLGSSHKPKLIESELNSKEKFVRSKKKKLESLEADYDRYLTRVNTLITDLKIENLEILELIKKKEKLRDSL